MKINLGATPLDALYVGATKVYPSQAAPATGTPDAPVLAADLTWNAPADHGSAIIGYEIAHDPAITVTQNKPTYAGAVCKKDAAHTIDYTALTITPATSMNVSGTTPFTDYKFRVRAINGNGAGAWSNEIVAQFNFNEATGGTVSDVPNYNGTGKKYRVHTFTTNGNFTILQAIKPFRVLVVGGGGGGGAGGGNQHGGGGDGGWGSDTTTALATGAHAITVGGGGGGGGAGGASTAFGITGNGGKAGAYMGGADTHGATNGPNSDAHGAPFGAVTTVPFQFGAPGLGVHAWRGNAGPPNTGRGGDGGLNTGSPGPHGGGSGVVIVAYQIG